MFTFIHADFSTRVYFDYSIIRVYQFSVDLLRMLALCLMLYMLKNYAGITSTGFNGTAMLLNNC